MNLIDRMEEIQKCPIVIERRASTFGFNVAATPLLGFAPGDARATHDVSLATAAGTTVATRGVVAGPSAGASAAVAAVVAAVAPPEPSLLHGSNRGGDENDEDVTRENAQTKNVQLCVIIAGIN